MELARAWHVGLIKLERIQKVGFVGNEAYAVRYVWRSPRRHAIARAR